MNETKTLEFKETTNTNTFLKTISAFANYTGGQIVFGVCDDGVIKGIDNPKDECLNLENKINDTIKPVPNYILTINSDNTITLEVEKGFFTPYLYNNKAYKRNDTATIEVDRVELNRLLMEGTNQTYEDQISHKQDLTFKQLEKELRQSLGISTISTDMLKTLGLISNNKYNNAAAIIADNNQFYGVDIIRYGRNINELMDRSTNDNVSIFTMYHEADDFYKKYYTYEKIEGSQRTKKELIPGPAFREALANALVHRFWDINSRIRISMFNDRIEITSPGGLPSSLNKNEYLNGRVSFLRNPIIANVFFRLDYIEILGSGIKRIKNAYEKSFSKPEFDIYDNSITVILPLIDDDLNLTDEEETILNVISKFAKTRAQIEEETNLNKSKVVRILKSLIDKNLIQRTGSGNIVKYNKINR